MNLIVNWKGIKIDGVEETNRKSAIKVLQLDCDRSLLVLAKNILELYGDFEIDLVSSFIQANEALEKKKYDVIVSGYFFASGKTGLDFFQELKVKGSTLPFILFSIYEEVANEALKKGVTKFVAMEGDCDKVYTELSKTIKEIKENSKQ